MLIGIPIWLLFPPKKDPVPSDAVMVIAGSEDGRHQLGADLVKRGISRNFVVSNPLGKRDEVGWSHCLGSKVPENALNSWCLMPDPVTTTGEALAMEELAKSEKWDTATVVTSRVHARRVKTMFNQCTNLDVEVIYVDFIDRYQVQRQLIHEIGGFLKFWIIKPC